MFHDACTPQLLEKVRDGSVSEALLSCLEVYPYAQLKTLDRETLRKRVQALLPDMAFASQEEPEDNATVSTEPVIPGKSLVGRILDGIAKPTLNVAFFYVNDPANSVWTRGHDEGRQQMEQALKDQVRVRTYVVGEEQAAETMEQAVAKDGAQLLIATAPTLLAPARQVAALHPGLKVLVCAVSVPYVGVRTYYSRLYESKFIAGAVAGALCGSDPIGYIARYPILGVPAAVNAFALGARMTNPNAKILLDWSCLEGDAVQRLWVAGARIISGHPVAASTPSNIGPGWSTALYADNGSFLSLASDFWDWGKTYEQIVRSVLTGGWDSEAPKGTAVSYWWGMSSGVVDVKLSEVVPEGVQQLAAILREGIRAGRINPFNGSLKDQNGRVRLIQGVDPTPEEIMRMNWLGESVIGRIPVLEELMPVARKTTELLALPVDKPEPAEKAESAKTAEKTAAADDPAARKAPESDASGDGAEDGGMDTEET
jgi:basic membrane lipoprotein Med (substrate-binding protein (PBP1-ABC) superfamily)